MRKFIVTATVSLLLTVSAASADAAPQRLHEGRAAYAVSKSPAIHRNSAIRKPQMLERIDTRMLPVTSL
jgi:hypothetical protein